MWLLPIPPKLTDTAWVELLQEQECLTLYCSVAEILSIYWILKDLILTQMEIAFELSAIYHYSIVLITL